MYCDLWPLAYDLWIVDRSTACDFTVYKKKEMELVSATSRSKSRKQFLKCLMHLPLTINDTLFSNYKSNIWINSLKTKINQTFALSQKGKS